MDDKLQWQFEIIDRMSSTSEKIADALDRTNDALGRLEKRQEQTDAAAKKADKSMKAWIHTIHDLAHIAEMGVHAVEGLADAALRVGEGVLDIGKDMLLAAGHAEKMRMSFDLLLGKPESGALLDYIDEIANRTAHTRAELQGAAQQLAFHGFEGEGLRNALAAAQDIEAVGGSLDSALERLGAIQATGRLSMKALPMLGIKKDDLLSQITTLTGDVAETAQKKLTSGGYKSEIVLEGIYRALEGREGGLLGARAVAAGKTLDGLVHKLAGLKDALFEGLANSAAFGRFESFLQNVLGLLDPASEFGRGVGARIEHVFSTIFDTAFGEFEGSDGKKNLEQAFDRMLDRFDKAWPAIKQGFEDAWEKAKGLAAAMGAIADALVRLTGTPESNAKDAIEDAVGSGATADLGGGAKMVLDKTEQLDLVHRAGKFADIDQFNYPDFDEDKVAAIQAAALEQYKLEMKQHGAAAAQGLADGLTSKMDAVAVATADLGAAASESLQSTLDIHSPSRVFHGFGEDTADGFTGGVRSRRAEVDDAMTEAFDVRAPRGAVGGGSINLGGVHLGGVTVSGGKDGAEELVGELERILPGALVEMIERATVALGVG